MNEDYYYMYADTYVAGCYLSITTPSGNIQLRGEYAVPVYVALVSYRDEQLKHQYMENLCKSEYYRELEKIGNMLAGVQ